MIWRRHTAPLVNGPLHDNSRKSGSHCQGPSTSCFSEVFPPIPEDRSLFFRPTSLYINYVRRCLFATFCRTAQYLADPLTSLEWPLLFRAAALASPIRSGLSSATDCSLVCKCRSAKQPDRNSKVESVVRARSKPFGRADCFKCSVFRCGARLGTSQRRSCSARRYYARPRLEFSIPFDGQWPCDTPCRKAYSAVGWGRLSPK